jgi:hypothetical protein
MLYLVAASHFIVSCLAQIQQAVETTRLSYLPEVVRQQQAAKRPVAEFACGPQPSWLANWPCCGLGRPSWSGLDGNSEGS